MRRRVLGGILAVLGLNMLMTGVWLMDRVGAYPSFWPMVGTTNLILGAVCLIALAVYLCVGSR